MQNFKMDFHVHSHFSPDSPSPMALMIESAIAKGITDIAFTEHMDFDSDQRSAVKNWVFDFDSYFTKVQEMQLKYPKIKLYRGVEIGLQSHVADKNRKVISENQFDFAIGSLHMVDGQDIYYSDLFETHSEKEAVWRYYECYYENLKAFSNFNVLGHLDMYLRYTDKAHDLAFSTYSDVVESLLKSAIEKGIGIEVNAGGYRYGLGHNNPKRDILELYHSLGGEIITLGSDAHKPDSIGAAYEENCALLQAIGFKYLCVFEKQKPIFKPFF